MAYQKVGNLKGPKGDAGASSWATPPVAWAASTAYSAAAPASVVTNGGSTYVCSTSHTSAAAFDATKFTLIAASGTAGARGSLITTGTGAPTATGSTQANDIYIDLSTGDLYQAS